MPERLSICLIGSSRYPVREPFAGGLEASIHLLARSLRARGHEVVLFAAPGSDPALGARELAVPAFSSSRAARADVGARPEEWMAEHHAYLGLMMDLVRGRLAVDVVHNNSLHHLPVAMAGAIAAPMVTTLHTPPLGWLESAVEYAGATTFVAVSEATRQAWSHALDARVVHNGVDTDAWRAGAGGRRAVWFGRVVPEKGVHDALDATHAAGLDLDIVGPALDPGYWATEVQPRLAPGDRYLGHLAQRDLAAVIRTSRVAVVTPHWGEPFGLVAAESLASGTPVAGYAQGGLSEIVTPEVGRLVRSGDLPALVEAIGHAAELSRSAAREHAVERFGVERMVRGYEDIYRELTFEGAAA